MARQTSRTDRRMDGRMDGQTSVQSPNPIISLGTIIWTNDRAGFPAVSNRNHGSRWPLTPAIEHLRPLQCISHLPMRQFSHFLGIFLVFLCSTSSDHKKISSSPYEGRKLTRNSWPFLSEKTTWSDKMQPRAADVVRRKKKLFHAKLDKILRTLKKKFVEKFQD